MYRFYTWISFAYFALAPAVLMFLAVGLFAIAVWEAATAFKSADRVDVLLNCVGLLIIGFAVVETAKFIAEEEIMRRRELRSPVESRRSLTKFITIIVIAASLEALVMVFKTGRQDIPQTIFPVVLFASASLALVGLGAYQWLSSRIEYTSPEEEATALATADAAAERRRRREP